MSTDETGGDSSDGEPWRDESTLRRLIEEDGLGISEVAERLGCDQAVVSDWVSRYDIGGHECPLCDRSFTSRSGLGIHCQSKHDTSIREYERRQGEHECPSCEYAFDSQHGLAAHHVREHDQSLAWKEVPCEWCGDTRRVRRSVLRKGKRVFCRGYSCRDAYFRENYSGQDNPNWRGGRTAYDAVLRNLGRSWYKSRETTRESAENSCEMCGITESETGRELDIHHIVPILSGGTNGDYNLMALCRTCHKTIEEYTRGIIDPVLVDWSADELPEGRTGSGQFLQQQHTTPKQQPQTELTEFLSD